MVWLRALNINNFVSYAFFSSLSLSDVCARGCCIYLSRGLDFRATVAAAAGKLVQMDAFSMRAQLILFRWPMQREIFKIDLSSANLTARIFQMDSRVHQHYLMKIRSLSSLAPFIQRSICEIFEKECKKRDDGQEETWSMKYVVYYFIHSMPRHSEQCDHLKGG
jgi:hypothetical protein